MHVLLLKLEVLGHIYNESLKFRNHLQFRDRCMISGAHETRFISLTGRNALTTKSTFGASTFGGDQSLLSSTTEHQCSKTIFAVSVRCTTVPSVLVIANSSIGWKLVTLSMTVQWGFSTMFLKTVTLF